mmetsp:Transcript_120173/g.340183  ORF Transcript_120173/g.340183 Transcript_120173/m.340183 type:complete len:108 (-) Transcript_120173:1043-1366(-)
MSRVGLNADGLGDLVQPEHRFQTPATQRRSERRACTYSELPRATCRPRHLHGGGNALEAEYATQPSVADSRGEGGARAFAGHRIASDGSSAGLGRRLSNTACKHCLP